MTKRVKIPGVTAQAGLATLAAMLAMPAGAQTAAAVSNGEAAAPSTGEIVVTAQRVAQGIQSVPVAVTAQSGAELRERGVTNVQSLQTSVPSLNVSSSPVGGNAGAQIFVRGVGQLDYTATQEPDVPVYVDGVYIARPVAAVFDFVDINRVEVLRGPQGTLFGRNALGGAVQIISQMPTQDFGGYAQFTGGSFNRRDVEAAANLPITEGLAVRIAGASRNDDGFTRSDVTGRRGNDHNDTFLRGTIRWQPDPTWDIILRGHYYRHKANTAYQSLTKVTDTPVLDAYNAMLAAQGLPQITSAMVHSNPYDTVSGFDPKDETRARGVSLEIGKKIGEINFKSITAYRKLDGFSGFNFTATPYPYLTSTTATNEKEFTQELQLYGKTLNNKLNWIVGGYYFHESNSQPQEVIELQDVIRTGPGLYDFTPDKSTGIDALTNLDQKSRSYAVYAQLSYEILPHLNLTAGIRGSWDHKELGSSSGNFSYTNIRPYAVQSKSWNQVTPKFGIDYKAADNILLYATVSEGYRAGGFNGHATGVTPPNAYNPEKLWDYEGGIKTDLFDKRLRFNLSGFYYDYKNYQASYNALVDGVLGVVVNNVAALTMYGIEAETRLKVTSNFDINGYFTAEHYKFHDLVPGTGAVRTDSQPPNAPKITAGASAEYRVPIGEWGQAMLRGDWAYKSKTQFFLPNLPGEAQKGFSVANARLTVRPTNDRYEVSVFGTNIFNKHYKLYAQSLEGFTGTILGSYARPAEWGASVRVNF